MAAIGIGGAAIVGLAAAGQERSADPLVAKAVAYVEAYERELSGIVAEEEYVQRWSFPGSFPEMRRLRSDFLMVKLKPSDPWVPFRDVFEMNGTPVRDRDERLQRLFLEAPATAAAEARRITDESARFNLGRFRRNINVPTLPLEFLRAGAHEGFRFRLAGEEEIDGTPTIRLSYDERQRPTIIRSSRGRDVPAAGRLWIDPRDGAIRRTLLRTTFDLLAMQIVVTYCPCEWGVLVPCTMLETIRFSQEELRATATYSNFRRFQVVVESKPNIK